MYQILESFLGALRFVIPVGSLLAWSAAVGRWFRGRPLLAFQPRRAAPWGLIDLLVVLIILSLVQFAFLSVTVDTEQLVQLEEMSANEQMAVLTSSQLASLVTLMIGFVLLHWRTGANLRDFGFVGNKLKSDMALGATAFVMLVVPVFAVQRVLTQWVESKHPLVDLVRDNPDPLFFALSGFAAVLVAPLAEEFLFRVLLQGWLERLSGVPRPNLREALLGSFYETCSGNEPVTPDRVAAESDEPSERPAAMDADVVAENAFRSPAHAPAPQTAVTHLASPARWPIVVSAGLFSLAHYGHGSDPVPLFLLAIGLGYLYQRTHRVVPCIIVHALLNLVSMLQLWVLAGQESV